MNDIENCSETYATLRVVGRSLDPESFSRVMGLEPTMSIRVGDTRPLGTRPRDEAIWAYSTQANIDSSNLADHVAFLVSLIPKGFKHLVPADCRAEIHCVWRSASGHGGPTLPALLLAELGGENIDLDFDLYFDDE